MDRYVTRPQSRYYSYPVGETIMPETMTVLEQREPYEATGLLNAKGDPLYRVKDAIGFKVTR